MDQPRVSDERLQHDIESFRVHCENTDVQIYQADHTHDDLCRDLQDARMELKEVAKDLHLYWQHMEGEERFKTTTIINARLNHTQDLLFRLQKKYGWDD